jgi:hypothetical protein
MDGNVVEDPLAHRDHADRGEDQDDDDQTAETAVTLAHLGTPSGHGTTTVVGRSGYSSIRGDCGAAYTRGAGVGA